MKILFLLSFLIPLHTFVGQPTVAVNSNIPYTYKENGEWKGQDIDLLNKIFDNYKIVGELNVKSGLKSLENKEIDIFVGGISITKERERLIDFSVPYENAGIKIMTLKTESYNLFENIIEGKYLKVLGSTLLKPEILEIGFWFGCFILLVAHIIWYLDRKSENISKNYFIGLWDAIYFSVVTSSTVGYGDITVKNFVSRLFVLTLIFTGIVFFSNFMGVVSAEYTINKLDSNISSVEDLKDKVVATKEGSTSEDWISKYTPHLVYVKTYKEAIQVVKSGRAEAFVFDSGFINYCVSKDPALISLSKLYEKQYYGFALSDESKFKEIIDQKILE